MPQETSELCPICRDPFRYKVEQLYLEGDLSAVRREHQYSRHEVETHMGHVADPEVLRTVAGLAGATAVAARLRQLEQIQGAILEAALTGVTIKQEDGTELQVPPDLKLALAAAREIRSTLVEVAKMAPALDSQQSSSLERTDLDEQIQDYLRRRGMAEGEGNVRSPSAPDRSTRELPSGERRALPAATPPR